MDDFLLIYKPETEIGNHIVMYVKADASAEHEKTMLTFGAFQFDENMRRAVLAFNKANRKYQITMKEYFDEDNGITADEAIENLNKDIAKGEVPDLLDLSVLTGRYASKGLLEDLTGYMEKTDEFQEGVFVDSAFAAMKQGEKLYYISPDFGISTLIGKAGYEEEPAGWSMEKVIAFHEQNPDKMLFYADTKTDLLNILLQGSFTEFCDWESGKCRFDSQAFCDILTFCNRAVSKDNRLEPNMTRNEAVLQEKVLWIDEADFAPQEIASYKKLFGGELAYIGYPGTEGGESYFSFEHQIGICSQSNAKDGAWEFLSMLLSGEYQEQYTDFSNGLNCIPIRQDCFDLLLTKLSNPQEDMEESEVLSSSEAEAFRSLVANTHEAVSYDIEMMKIIEEEAQLYFEGKRDEREAASFIQERCRTYMEEQG
ncbi:MAG: extracellular solute-binding protein [Clostridium sp.]|nr:extracellular solute-binding protein [Clostridium sp.]